MTQSLREFGRDVRNLELVPEAEFFLYVTRDVQLLEEMTRPALGRADVVIADRFLFSAEVLARFGRGLPESYVRPVLQAAARGLEPDLVVLVDVDPHIARARRRVAKVVTADRRPPSRKGLGGVGMQHRFREGYRELAARDPARWVTVDNDRDLDATVELVTQILHTAHHQGRAAALARGAHRGRHQRADAGAAHHDRGGAGALPATASTAAMEREPQTAAYLLAGLYGPGIDERRQRLAALAPETVLSGLAGLVDPLSWQLREQLHGEHPARVARSLRGVARLHPQAAPLRAALAATAPVEVLATLEGADDDEAWQLRKRLHASDPDVVDRLAGRHRHRRRLAPARGLAGQQGRRGRPGRVRAGAGAGALADRPGRRARLGAAQARCARRRPSPPWPACASCCPSGPGNGASVTWCARPRRCSRRWPGWTIRAPGTMRAADGPAGQGGHRFDERAGRRRGLAAARGLRRRVAVDGGEDRWGRWPTSRAGGRWSSASCSRYPDNISLLKHVAAIAVGAHIDPDLNPE